MLKVGFAIHGDAKGLITIDNTWKTCCALHNMLLEVDGLDTDWEGTWGDHEPRDLSKTCTLINGRMSAADKEYDCSGMGSGPSTVWQTTDEHGNEFDNVPQHIRNVGFDTFRNYLVTHFHYLFNKKSHRHRAAMP